MTMDDKRSEKIHKIVEFVEKNRESHASRTVCKEMLGDYYVPFDDETREQLEERLAGAAEEQFAYCYDLIS